MSLQAALLPAAQLHLMALLMSAKLVLPALLLMLLLALKLPRACLPPSFLRMVGHCLLVFHFLDSFG